MKLDPYTEHELEDLEVADLPLREFLGLPVPPEQPTLFASPAALDRLGQERVFVSGAQAMRALDRLSSIPVVVSDLMPPGTWIVLHRGEVVARGRIA